MTSLYGRPENHTMKPKITTLFYTKPKL